MTQAQFDALVSFDFNTGSLSKSTIDDKLNAGNIDGAMATLLTTTLAVSSWPA